MFRCRRAVGRRSRDDRRGPVAPDESEGQGHVHRRKTALRHGRQAQRADHVADGRRIAARVPAAVQRVHRQTKRGGAVTAARSTLVPLQTERARGLQGRIRTYLREGGGEGCFRKIVRPE